MLVASHCQKPNPYEQLSRYELHNPIWKFNRDQLIESYAELDAATFGIEDLVGSRIRLLAHQAEVVSTVLSDEACRLGVTSADSSAPLRRAFLGTNGDNYWTRNGKKYAAIRVPGTKRGASSKRGVNSTDEVLEKNSVTIEQLKQKEQEVLRLLRSYDAGEANQYPEIRACLFKGS